MNATDLWWGIGDALDACLALIYDEKNGVTTIVNTGLLLFGFFGLFYWLRHQLKFNEAAKNNPNQLK